MSVQEFDWDPAKEASNIRKHGITFEEASTVFDDIYGRFIYDDDHSDNEERFLLLGRSLLSNMLVVCHCYRNGDAIVRIISARKATNKERKTYGGGL